MRIQHNIPAMNSLVNYTRNNNALAKNLEKLSSGYRINSAADDAAGLAISEKMRSQIAGLEKAQDNANDGISLVQVAEGALTEVNSMLTRLTELATQSANGTFEDGVDRVNIQEETNAILEEIDRISKATNFNGINLLDGSLSDGKQVSSTSTFSIPDRGELQDDIALKTIVHEKYPETAKTSFSVDLHNYSFNNETGSEFIINIGEDKLTIAGDGNAALKASDIASAIVAGKTGNNVAVQQDGADLTAGEVTIGGQTFTVTSSGSTLTFEQKDKPTSIDEVVKGDMVVKIEGGAAEATIGEYKLKVTDGATANNKDTEFDIKFRGIGDTTDTKATITVACTKDADAATTADELKAAILADTTTTAGGKKISDLFDVTVEDDTIVLKSKTAGSSGEKIVSFENDNTVNGGAKVDLANAVIKDGADAGDADAATGGGTYNVSTTNVTNGSFGAPDQLASTSFELKSSMVADGASITIGKESYVFKTDAKSEVKAGTNQKLVDVSDLDPTSSEYMSDVVTRLTKAASGNTAFTVGHDNNSGRITIAEKDGQTAYKADELDTVKEIAEKLSYSTAVKEGKSLTLQIGDTNADYQHVSVQIADMSSAGLGLTGLNLSDQKSAGEAIATIKNAVNTVSMQRGKLGALQNRLDHTLNNLETTTTNISASESQIRDVNMAKEMTAYTKNNILAQAAQSMLAQANSMPQGVLQLLQ